MPDELTLARKFRAALLRRDAAAQAEILKAYEAIWQRLSNDIERIATELQAGGNSPSLLFEQQRLKRLQDQISIEINRLAEFTSKLTVSEQSTVIELAREQAVRLMQAATRSPVLRASFATLATDELTHLVGVAQDGSPVADLFRQLARSLRLESDEAIKNALLEGMALGSNPRAIVAAVKRKVDARDGDLARDPRIARRLDTTVRQQVLGAYREATRLGYEENKELLGGWVWTAVRSATTCVICWAMDGTIFPAGAPMVSHINCRCVMRPLLPGQSPGELGPDAFARLERGVQKEILGDLAFTAYETGMVKLDEFVGFATDFRWGDSRFRRGLDDIIGKETVHKLRLRQR